MKHHILLLPLLAGFCAGPIQAAPSATAGPAAVSPGSARKLALDGAANFRDLGGYRSADGRHVKWGMLYRSDALDSLTPIDWQKLEALNIVRITDFRADREVRRNPNHLSPHLATLLHHVPLDYLPKASRESGVAAVPTFRAPKSDVERLLYIDRALMDVYPRMARETSGEYGAWLRSLLDGPPGGAHVFHCTGGADRTGLAAAILLLALGVPREQVTEDYLLTNDFLYSPEGRALLDRRMQGKLPAEVRVHTRYLDAALDAAIADYGSFDAYLRDGLKIDDQTRQQLRRKFLE